jgi:uncharacterized coiled-coil protein SlyX
MAVKVDYPLATFERVTRKRALHYEKKIEGLKEELAQTQVELARVRQQNNALANGLAHAHGLINSLFDRINGAKTIVMAFNRLQNPSPAPNASVLFSDLFSYQERLLESLNGVHLMEAKK